VATITHNTSRICGKFHIIELGSKSKLLLPSEIRRTDANIKI
jgi:hypothetical protein